MKRQRLDFTRPHLLRDEGEYDAAVAEIDRLLDLDPKPGTEPYDRLEFLSTLVEVYEDERIPVRSVSAQDAVDFMLEQKGLDRTHLADIMGGKSRVSEFFNGRRELSKTQVQALYNELGIPAEILLGLPQGKSARRHAG
jgi:HTH-type transcriptional regulator / antitoxin HigA